MKTKQKKKNKGYSSAVTTIIVIILLIASLIVGIYRKQHYDKQVSELSLQISALQEAVYFYSQYRYDVGDMIRYCPNNDCYDKETGKRIVEVYVIRDIENTNTDNIFKITFICQNLVGGKEIGNYEEFTAYQMANEVELIKKESGE
jgi:hypothetical protein